MGAAMIVGEEVQFWRCGWIAPEQDASVHSGGVETANHTSWARDVWALGITGCCMACSSNTLLDTLAQQDQLMQGMAEDQHHRQRGHTAMISHLHQSMQKLYQSRDLPCTTSALWKVIRMCLHTHTAQHKTCPDHGVY